MCEMLPYAVAVSLLVVLSLTSCCRAFSTKPPPSSSKSYDLVVIGGGSAGLTAAKFAATFGKSAAIIEKSRMGGDCTWSGCVPSKSLIASAKTAHAVKNASPFGINVSSFDVDMKVIKKRIDENIQHIYEEDDSPEALKKMGIDVIQGMAAFHDAKTLLVTNDSNDSEVYASEGVLIATGAQPLLPNIDGLDDVDFITYEEAFSLDHVPAKMSFVGCGPIGCELAQAYSRLGAEVTILAPACLPRGEPEASEVMLRVFEAEGIRFEQGRPKSVKTGNGKQHIITSENGQEISGDLLLVAVGRTPTVTGMDLEKLGVQLNEKGGVEVDSTLQTSVKGVYAAGDCTGDRQFTHYAGYQGAIAARNILLPLTDPGVVEHVPGTTFTEPEIASIGLTEKEAKNKMGENKVGVAFKRISETDRGICEGIEEGFIKIIYEKRGYKIIGATIASPVAGELIAEIAVAMKTGLSFDQLATVMHTYPSHSIALQTMAAEIYYEKLGKSKSLYNFLKRLGL